MTNIPYWQTSSEPWVVGNWKILNEDRVAQRQGKPYWTLVPEDALGVTSLCRGPYGRKALMPESVIHACGYDVDGLDFDADFLELLLSQLNDSPKEAK